MDDASVNLWRCELAEPPNQHSSFHTSGSASGSLADVGGTQGTSGSLAIPPGGTDPAGTYLARDPFGGLSGAVVEVVTRVVEVLASVFSSPQSSLPSLSQTDAGLLPPPPESLSAVLQELIGLARDVFVPPNAIFRALTGAS